MSGRFKCIYEHQPFQAARHVAYFIFSAVFVLLLSCHTRDRKKEIEQALKNYDRLIIKMDADSIAMMYTPDGDMGDMAHGRTWIRRFLSSLTNVKVLSCLSTSDKVDFNNDTCMQHGRYQQHVIAGDTLHLSGAYEAKWIWMKNEGWRIRSMITKPDN